MSSLIVCAHCQHIFPEASKHLCPDCASGFAQLESELAAQDDLDTARIHAVRRLRGLKRFREMQPPMSFHDLLSWLVVHPHVRITGPTQFGAERTSRDEAFMAFRTGLLWFMGDDGLNYIPISRERAETGITFDPVGFTLYEFGAHIRVEYMP